MSLSRPIRLSNSHTLHSLNQLGNDAHPTAPSPSSWSASSSTRQPPLTSLIQRNGYCGSCHTHHRPEIRVDSQSPHKKRLVLQHVDHCPRTRPRVIPLFFHGAAGSGTGSRLKGHTRMGGNKIQERNMLHGPVCVTNEHNSSGTCCFCFHPTRLARAKRQTKKGLRMVRVHGAVECCNPTCVAFRLGYTIRPRDTNAAVNIALAGYTLLHSSDRKTLARFDPRRPSWSPPFPNTSSTMTGPKPSSLIASRSNDSELSVCSTYVSILRSILF